MRKKTLFNVVLTLSLALLLAACASGGEKLAVSDEEYADYVGAQFRGADPWGDSLTVTVKSIVDGRMEWTFTDSFDGATLYQEMKDTRVEDGAAAFDIQGTAAEDKDITFQYQGTVELTDGAVALTFESGAVTEASPEGGSSFRDVGALEGSGLSNRVTLEKPEEGELNTYTVQAGDSIHSIAEQYGLSTRDLAVMNQTVIIETAKAHGYAFDDVIEYAKYLFPGEVLVVPAAD